MDFNEVKKLIKILEENKLKKIMIKKGDEEILLEKEDSYSPPPPPPMHHHHENIHPEKKALIEKEKGVFVTSPMVGTFYIRPAPDQPPFIKVGDIVDEDTVVCIVEAMKVMNEVKAGVKGKIVEIYLQDSHPVEYGSKLFRIE